MKKIFQLAACLIIVSCNSEPADQTNNSNQANSVTKIEMHLSAFGVESDNFPNIDATLDFQADTSNCRRWFYEPSNRDSIYSLSKKEMREVYSLLTKSNLSNFKRVNKAVESDQPSSKIIVFTKTDSIVFQDYGLLGLYPLNEIYKIVYKY